MTLTIESPVKTMYGAKELYRRWNVCLSTVRRKMLSKEIKTVRFGSRIMVPVDEVMRIDQEGLERLTSTTNQVKAKQVISVEVSS